MSSIYVKFFYEGQLLKCRRSIKVFKTSCYIAKDKCIVGNILYGLLQSRITIPLCKKTNSNVLPLYGWLQCLDCLEPIETPLPCIKGWNRYWVLWWELPIQVRTHFEHLTTWYLPSSKTMSNVNRMYQPGFFFCCDQ